MLKSILSQFYERDFRKLIDEVNLFKDEANLWRTQRSIKNSSGNLVLHIIGGTNFLFGTVLAQTGYVRNRDEEFSKKSVPRSELITQLELLIPLVTQTIKSVSMEAEYPRPFDGEQRSNISCDHSVGASFKLSFGPGKLPASDVGVSQVIVARL